MSKRVSRRTKVKSDPLAGDSEDYQTSLSLLYGVPGVPDGPKYLLPAPSTPPPEINMKKHKVIAIQDPHRGAEFPQLYLNVFLQGPYPDTYLFPNMFVRTGSTLAKSIDDADLVVFGGGADVDPRLYGLKESDFSRSMVHYDEARDTADIDVYLKCLEKGIPMVGICRGAQFLAVMNGAKLYIDVNKHNSPHSMYDHQRKRHIEKVSSAHHQMVIPDPKGGMEIIATASVSDVRVESTKVTQCKTGVDLEAFWYPETLCLGVQGHPEYSGYTEYTKWFLELLDECFLLNRDTDWVKEDGAKYSHRRLKPELLDQRASKLADILPPSITMSVDIN